MLPVHLLFLFIWFCQCSVDCSKRLVKVLIAGGGPAGLFAANALLSRQSPSVEYHVHVLESKEDPRTAPVGPRSYSLGINMRGQSAFKYFEDRGRAPGLWEAIRKEGVESESFFLHLGKLKLQIRKPSLQKEGQREGQRGGAAPPPTLLLQRSGLCALLLRHLQERHGEPSGRLRVSFGERVAGVDLGARRLHLQGGEGEGGTEGGRSLSYDVLIGCDGATSAVRRALQEQEGGERGGFDAEAEALGGRFKVMELPCPPALESDAVHAMEGKAFSLFCIPTRGQRLCALLSWKGETPPFLREGAGDEEVRGAVAAAFPLFGPPPPEALAQLRRQGPSEVRTVRCNRYHSRGGAALLLGDAAHSTGGALGQGLNSALLDVVALDQCLEETGEDWERVPALFSHRQAPEGLALWQLLQLPPRGLLWRLLYEAAQLLRRLRGGQSTQRLLSQSLTPFSLIAQQNKFWVDMVTKKFRPLAPSP